MAVDTCVVTGILYDLSGSPRKGVGIRVRSLDNPVAVGTQGIIVGESLRFLSDAVGQVQFALIQGGSYQVEVPNREVDFVRTVLVPEAASVDLADLLYPFVVSADWEDDDPIDEEVGEYFTIGVVGTLSSGATSDVTSACTFEISDDTIIKYKEEGMFKAKAVGTATITISALSQSIALAEPDGDPVYRTGVEDALLPGPLIVTVS